MEINFVPVHTGAQIKQLAQVAKEIWNEYWPALIGQAQTDYMVEMMLSSEAISRDMAEHGYRYWLLVNSEDKTLGFTGGALEELTGDQEHDASITHSQAVNKNWPRRWFISKVYLYGAERGKHYASRVVAFFEQLCRDEDIPAMYLTVNRDNELGIRAYEGLGFTTVEDVDANIGSGFVMTDHIMLKEVAQ